MFPSLGKWPLPFVVPLSTCLGAAPRGKLRLSLLAPNLSLVSSLDLVQTRHLPKCLFLLCKSAGTDTHLRAACRLFQLVRHEINILNVTEICMFFLRQLISYFALQFFFFFSVSLNLSEVLTRR